jgi:CheY-like chemotaxis protein
MSPIADKSVKQLLVVDECWENLLLMQSILESQGYEIRLAKSGEAALTEIAKAKPDLVILDLTIPNCKQQSGFEIDDFGVTCYLRTNQDFVALPILWLTADRTIHLSQAEALGADALLYKPFDIDELFLTVASLLGDRETVSFPIQEQWNAQSEGHYASSNSSISLGKTCFVQVGEQDPLRQQQAELAALLHHHPQAFWEKLIAEGYGVVREEGMFLATS